MTDPVPTHLHHVFRQGPSVLWVGAGVSCQADPPLPTLWGLVKDLKAERWPEGPAIVDPYEFIDAYLKQFKARGALAAFLESKVRPGGRDARPGSLHRALARLVEANKFTAVIDTNYDLVLQRACTDANAAFLPSVLSANLELPTDGWPRYWTLHGDHSAWLDTVLDGASYATFGQRHTLAIQQLEVYLRQRSVLFVGCSMQDPRIVDWLAGLSADARRNLHGLVAVVDPSSKAELEDKAKTEPKYKVLIDTVTLVEAPTFGHLPQWFGELANAYAP